MKALVCNSEDKELYKTAFVILHFLTYDDTHECIDSILNNVDYFNYQIVVVDNGSSNDSAERLCKHYSNNLKVKVIINEFNLGFAKGNNVGYRYAKYDLKSDFIILINNDTIIKQRSFINKIIQKYKSDKFHIMGPDIISLKDNCHQNPQRESLVNKIEIVSEIKKSRINLILNYIGIENMLINIKKFIKLKMNMKNIYNIDYGKEKNDVQLHGSCLIFSPDYIKKYEGLYDKTYMYREEDILFYFVKRYGLIMKYYPKVCIFHKEDSSTNYVYKEDKYKRRFYYKNMIRSSKLLLELINKS